MKLTPNRRKLVEAKIKQLYKEVLKETDGMGNAEPVWSGSGWAIKKYKNRGGTMSLSVENTKTGFIDYPIYYDHNGKIAYDYPEKVPQPIKDKIAKLYPTIK